MGNLYHNRTAQWVTYAVFFAALAVIPMTVGDSFLLNQLATYGVYGMLALSISLCWGFGGILFRARVSGPFFAIMTLAMLSAFYTILPDRQPYTGGVNGLTPPSAFQFAGVEVDPYSPIAYWVVFFLLLGATVLAKLITQSSFGLVTQAIRDDSERVRFLGYSVAGYETMIYTVSGLIAAVAGCCWVMLVQYVSPAQLDVGFSLSMVIWAAIGGRYSLLGSIIGAFLIQGAQSYLGDTFLATWLLILGGFFIVVVRFLPNGLASLLESGLGMLAKSGSSPAPDGGANGGVEPDHGAKPHGSAKPLPAE